MHLLESLFLILLPNYVIEEKGLLALVLVAIGFLSSYLASRLSDFSAESMELMKRLTYQVREYWYMGSMLARSVMEKNRTEEWTAIGL